MKRNKFSLSHYKLLTCEMGRLIPIACFEVLPGDTVQMATSALIRVAPLVTPVMHPVHIKIHHWYVPNRIIWENFEYFITDETAATLPDFHDHPKMAFNSVSESSLAHYLGLPTGTYSGAEGEFNALPFRAYAKIYNECYRDQDVSARLLQDEGNGLDANTNRNLALHHWEKDYFTTARPWEQKGPSMKIPQADFGVLSTQPFALAPNQDSATGAVNVQSDATGILKTTGLVNDTSLWLKPNTMIASASPFAGGSGAPSINQLREAFALQRFAEARARYGSRYTEYLRYLGIKSSDARLQRPEYLGGGKQTIQFSEVLSTANAGGDVVGDLRGHGIGALRSNRFRRFFEEHGFIMSLMCVSPKPVYGQGIHKMWKREVVEDYFQKELQHLGQQPIYNREIHYGTNPNSPFGYQDRYDEYRRMESSVSGSFLSTDDSWHMARLFTSTPTLNEAFLTGVPTKRNQADTNEVSLKVMCNHSIQARRMIAKVPNPHVF